MTVLRETMRNTAKKIVKPGHTLRRRATDGSPNATSYGTGFWHKPNTELWPGWVQQRTIDHMLQIGYAKNLVGDMIGFDGERRVRVVLTEEGRRELVPHVGRHAHGVAS